MISLLIGLLFIVILFAAQGLYRNLGRKTFDALPEHLDQATEWQGKDDDDHWYTKWRKSVKGWFAFGPSSNYGWARFRHTPILLFGLKGKGLWRIENLFSDDGVCSTPKGVIFFSPNDGSYISRVQYWSRWHISLHWPLFLCWHFYYRSPDFSHYPYRAKLNGWMGYIGIKRDTDCYWLSLYLGRSFK